MQDGTQKNIDLDALVDTLLRERQGDAAGQSVSPPAEIQAEDKPTSEPDKVPIPEPDTPSAPTIEPQSACPASVPSSVEDGTDVARPQPTDSRKKASLKGLFRRKNKAQPETEVEDEGWSDWDLKPIGHYRVGDEPAPASDVELIVEEVPAKESPSAASMDEFPPVQAVAETITMPVVLPSGMPVSREDATRVIPVKNSQPAPEPEPEPEPLPDDQLPDQLSLEEMVRVEDIDPEAPEPEEEPEELLQRARQERIRDFTFNGEEEEANEPEEEVEPEDSPVYYAGNGSFGAGVAGSYPACGRRCPHHRYGVSYGAVVCPWSDDGHQLPCRFPRLVRSVYSACQRGYARGPGLHGCAV